MAFDGRTVQSVESKNIGGLAEHQNILSISQGYAQDMDNWELDGNGAIQVRAGLALQSTVGTDLRHFDSFYTIDGTQVWVAVSSNKFWEASSPAGPWTDRSGTCTFSSVDDWNGDAIQGKYVLANGVDQPIIFETGSDARTIKEASLLPAPQSATCVGSGTPGAIIRRYIVTAITARGESAISNVCENILSVGTTTAADFNTIQWVDVPGAQGYNIYVQSVAWSTSIFYPIGSVGALTNEFIDNGQTPELNNPYDQLNTIALAYNTPLYWDSHPPKGFTVVARGQAQRVIAYRDVYWWASSLSDPLDWFTPNNAFNDQIYGCEDNTIQCVGSLFDYTVFFTKTNSVIFVGNTYSTWAISRMLHVGCEAPRSLLNLGNDLWFWSEFGPSTLARVQAGAEVQSDIKMAENVKLTVNSYSNRAEWTKIVGFKDLGNNRIGFAYPNGTSPGCDKAILFDFTTGGNSGWSRHSVSLADGQKLIATQEAENRVCYGAYSTGQIFQMYSGITDWGQPIAGTYETGWYDSQSSLNRYILWLDLFTDKTRGNYTFQVDLYYDMNSTPASTHTLTQSQTDGVTVALATTVANSHRIYTHGMGRYFKFKFTCTNSSTLPRILGWRPEMRVKGAR